MAIAGANNGNFSALCPLVIVKRSLQIGFVGRYTAYNFHSIVMLLFKKVVNHLRTHMKLILVYPKRMCNYSKAVTLMNFIGYPFSVCIFKCVDACRHTKCFGNPFYFLMVLFRVGVIVFIYAGLATEVYSMDIIAL